MTPHVTRTSYLSRILGPERCPLLAMAPFILAGGVPSCWSGTRTSPPHYYNRRTGKVASLRRLAAVRWTVHVHKLPEIRARLSEPQESSSPRQSFAPRLHLDLPGNACPQAASAEFFNRISLRFGREG